MVDVGGKANTKRRAVARARVTMARATFERLRDGDTPKGDVLAVARIAGIGGAKRTSELIPLCHPLALSRCDVDVVLEKGGVTVLAACETVGPTGVEMEALSAASIAALAIYDMLKAIDRAIHFSVELVEKSGGKSGDYRRDAT